MSTKQFFIVVSIILIGGTIGIGLAFRLFVAVLPQPTCTIGVVGAAANVTFIGSNAQADCNGAVQQFPSTYYIMTNPPTGNEICEGQDINSDHFIVRDTGLLNLVGNQLCKMLLQVTPTQ